MQGPHETPAQLWARLDADRSGLLTKCERYAALTIPKLCLPGGTTVNTSQTHDFQSLGAAAVNHLTNRLMLALFRPGDPFFRIDPGKSAKAKLQQNGVKPEDLAPALAAKELEAVAVLDQRAVRPKLYQAGRHLIVTGNVLMELGKNGTARTYGLRNYCVKRTAIGKVHTIAIAERLKFDELEKAVRDVVPGKQPGSEVTLYRVIRLQDDGSYVMKQAVDSTLLPEQFDGRWPEAKLPYHALAWDLADEADYGTGLVEDYEGDFESLSALSESLLDGSILTTEMRWLVNPGGVTSVEDFRRSRNGDALAGQEGDIAAVSGGDPRSIEVAIKVIELYSQRLSRGFLLQSAMVRNAERVTAEEIRTIAMELETAFGGVYSQLGLIWQKPVATWCLADIDLEIRGLDLEVTVITGLEALSRNAQLEKLRAALGDLAMFEQLPDGLKARIDWRTLAGFVGQGRGINLLPFLKSEETVRQEQEQAMADQASTAAATAAGEAAAQPQGTATA